MKILKYIESHYTDEVMAKPELVSFKTEDDELRSPDRLHVHRAELRLSLRYCWPTNVTPPNLPDYIIRKFARELYGELEPELLELQFHLHELRSMGAPVESAINRINHMLAMIQGRD